MLGFSPGNGFLSFLGKNKNPNAKSISYGGAKPGISDIPGLTTALAAKANASHSQAISTITGLVDALAAKASSAHAHAMSEITGLVDALDDKVGVEQLASVFAAFSPKDNVQDEVQYKGTSQPSGTGAQSGEQYLYCPVGDTPEIWKFTASWAFDRELDVNDRIIWKTNGHDTNLTYARTNKIYTWTGTSLTEYTLAINDLFLLDSDGLAWRFSGTACVEFPGNITDLLVSMTYSPSNYAPTAGGKLYNHLEGLDTKLGTKVNKDASGNVGVGTGTFGTNAANVLALAIGTAPASSPANAVQLAAVDSYDSKLEVLMHFDGVDGSTVFTDEIGHTFTPAGNTQLDTAQKKFGTASCLFDGAGDTLVCTHDDFPIMNQEFTIDFWVKFSSVVATQSVYDCRSTVNATDGLMVILIAGNICVYDSTTRITGSALLADTWYHIAVVGNGVSIKLYVNGTQVGSTWYTNYNYTSRYIGFGFSSEGANYFSGWLDEFRLVTKRLWITNFTSPTEAYSMKAELEVRDEDGNVTTLSPHNFSGIPSEIVAKTMQESDGLAWAYHSKKNGKEITVDMFRAIKALEEITGEKFIYIS